MRRVRRRFRNVVLCDRDFEILRLMFESKVMSREQIGIYFFQNASKQTVNLRLQKIMELGLICRKPISLGYKIIYAYSLTQYGLTKIKPLLPHRVETQSRLSECPLHDISLNDIRQAFEARNAVHNYYTENVLQTCPDYKSDEKFRQFVQLNSDAMAEVDSSVGVLNLAIEFDTVYKSNIRYLKKIKAYYFSHRVDGVLYICANENILSRLLKVDSKVAERHRRKPLLYFALLEDVTKESSELKFTNAAKHSFYIR